MMLLMAAACRGYADADAATRRFVAFLRHERLILLSRGHAVFALMR